MLNGIILVFNLYKLINKILLFIIYNIEYNKILNLKIESEFNFIWIFNKWFILNNNFMIFVLIVNYIKYNWFFLYM